VLQGKALLYTGFQSKSRHDPRGGKWATGDRRSHPPRTRLLQGPGSPAPLPGQTGTRPASCQRFVPPLAVSSGPEPFPPAARLLALSSPRLVVSPKPSRVAILATWSAAALPGRPGRTVGHGSPRDSDVSALAAPTLLDSEFRSKTPPRLPYVPVCPGRQVGVVACRGGIR